MPYGYVCENQEDYRALNRIGQELATTMPRDEKHADELDAKMIEIDNLMTEWEKCHDSL